MKGLTMDTHMGNIMIDNEVIAQYAGSVAVECFGIVGMAGVNVKDGLVFSKDGDRIWKCRNCGHIVIGPKAPEVCPVCVHPKAYFEIKAENY
mgnify:CR=1 FL=1